MNKIKEKKYSILSLISKYSFVFVFIFALIMPIVFVGATPPLTNGTPPLNNGTPPLNNGTPPLNNGTPSGAAIKIDAGIKNPISFDDIPAFIKAIIDIVLIVGIPLLVLAIIYAGFLFVKAQGNSGELEIAKRTLLYTIIGGALLLGAFVIAKAIGSTFKEIERTS